MKNKQTSMKKGMKVPAGPSGVMHKRSGAGPVVPGQTATVPGKKGGFAKGGSTKMFGKQTVKAKSPA